jgi:hypothetical protein
MFHPFDSPRKLTREQWKARARAIQKRLEGLSIDELMRGGRARQAPHLDIHGLRRSGYDPNQPRVPAGHPDGGQWTDDYRWTDDERWTGHPLIGAQFAAGRELPPIGPLGGRLPLILRRLLQILQKRRSDNLLYDLFGKPRGAVSMVEIDGEPFYGSSSGLPLYTSRDRAEADAMRDILLQKYPDLVGSNIGEKPMDGLYHAEANALLRAARDRRELLAGRKLEVVTDRPMCPSCQRILPKIGLELGNPTVTFIGPRGEFRTMRDGRWDDLRGYE